MLVELAVSDAYGAGFEVVDSEIVELENDLTRYRKHPTHGLKAGQYTDDTQMSIGLAELLVEGIAWTPINIANKFVEVYKRDKRMGYARRFQAFLDSVNSGQEFLDKIIPTSDKSGSAMRATPLGIIEEVTKLREYATIQAKLTHDTSDGIISAQASALLTHYFIYQRGPQKFVGKFLNRFAPTSTCDWDDNYVGKVGQKGWMSVQAAVTAIKQNSSLSDLLKDCIDFTGDTDTVATIAMGAASNAVSYKKDIPFTLIKNLENGAYGRDYLTELDTKLMLLKGII